MKVMKVNDKVQIINWLNKGLRPNHWNGIGKMDEWCNRIVTIDEIYPNGKIRIKEDKHRWIWFQSDFKLPFLDNELFEI